MRGPRSSATTWLRWGPLWIVDAACWLFALWTLLCHGVVFSRGTPRDLVVVVTAAAVLLPLLLWAARGRFGGQAVRTLLFDPDPVADPTALEPVGVEPPLLSLPRRLLVAGLGIGALGMWLWSGRYGMLWGLAMLLSGGLLLWFSLSRVSPFFRDPARASTEQGRDLGLSGESRPQTRLSPHLAPAPASGSVILLGSVAAGLALLALRLSRPDTDEAFYQALASSLQRFPQAPLLGFDVLHGHTSQPLGPSPYRVHSFELFYGFVGWCTGQWPIKVAHGLLPAVTAALWPLSLYRLTREIAPRAPLWPVLGTIAICLGDGSTHAGFGNFSLVRLFQGKAVFVTVAVPLIFAYAVRFGRAPRVGRGIRLTVVQIMAVGLSSSALPLTPLIAAAGVWAGLAPGRVGAQLRTLLYAICTSLYPLVVGLWLSGLWERMVGLGAARGGTVAATGQALSNLGGGGAVAAGQALSQPAMADTWSVGMAAIQAACERVLGPPSVAGVYLGALLLAPVLLPSRGARFAVSVLALWFLGLYNPFLYPWVSKVVLVPAIFFRGCWVVPFPLLLSLCLSALPDLGLQLGGKGWVRPLWLGLTCACFVWLVPTRPTWAADNRVGAPFWGLKVEPEFAVARAAARLVPPEGGVVCMPTALNRWLSAMPERAFPTLAKVSYLSASERPAPVFLAGCMEARRRYPACSPTAIARRLLALDVAVVSVPLASPQRGAFEGALRRLHFRPRRRVLGYGLWSRDAPGDGGSP